MTSARDILSELNVGPKRLPENARYEAEMEMVTNRGVHDISKGEFSADVSDFVERVLDRRGFRH